MHLPVHMFYHNISFLQPLQCSGARGRQCGAGGLCDVTDGRPGGHGPHVHSRLSGIQHTRALRNGCWYVAYMYYIPFRL